MKIGVCFNLFNNGFPRYGDERYKKVAEFGFDAIDFTLWDVKSPVYTLGEDEAKKFLENERKLIEEAGIFVSQVHAPGGVPTDADVENRMVEMKKSIWAAHHLGCKNWVAHPLMTYSYFDRGTEDAKKTFDVNVSFYRELSDYAKDFGVTICIENLPCKDYSISKPEETLNLIKAIGKDNVKMCLDTGHVTVWRDLNLRDEVLKLGDIIKVLHVHDNELFVDGHLFPYYGQTNWKEFVDTLKEINYEGVFSMEIPINENYPDDAFEYLAKALSIITKKVINL